MVSRMAVVLFMGTLLVWISSAPSWGFQPQTNGNGVQWESGSAEAWSGSFQANSSGAILELAGAADSSVDTVNGSGVTAYIGLLDPILPGGPCTPAMDPNDYDLNEDGFVDAKDLIELIAIIDEGMENAFDLNCDGVTNQLDLIEFAKRWKIDIPVGG